MYVVKTTSTGYSGLQLLPSYTHDPWYQVKNWAYETYQMGDEKGVIVTLTLRRDLTGILLTSYFPSFLMNFINHASIYITGDTKYDLIYTINITSLMVLASIYLSFSTTLPSTPDIKPVETWLLFNLGYPFFIIILHVILQVKILNSSSAKINIYTSRDWN